VYEKVAYLASVLESPHHCFKGNAVFFLLPVGFIVNYSDYRRSFRNSVGIAEEGTE
jgi:hypothetical protein